MLLLNVARFMLRKVVCWMKQRAKSRKIGAKYLTLLIRIIIISPIRDTVDLTVKLWSFHTPNLGVIPEFPHSPEFCFFVCHLRRYMMLPILGQGALLEQGRWQAGAAFRLRVYSADGDEVGASSFASRRSVAVLQAAAAARMQPPAGAGVAAWSWLAGLLR